MWSASCLRKYVKVNIAGVLWHRSPTNRQTLWNQSRSIPLCWHVFYFLRVDWAATDKSVRKHAFTWNEKRSIRQYATYDLLTWVWLSLSWYTVQPFSSSGFDVVYVQTLQFFADVEFFLALWRYSANNENRWSRSNFFGASWSGPGSGYMEYYRGASPINFELVLDFAFTPWSGPLGEKTAMHQ